MNCAIQIRGIYATALTRFFLDKGALIVSPSRTIRDRFGNPEQIVSEGIADVEIRDLENGQGVMLEGSTDAVGWAADAMGADFFDAIFRLATSANKRHKEGVSVEFPYFTKATLDNLRNRVVPTVECHHRLRLITPDYVDAAEEKVTRISPGERRRIGRKLMERFVWQAYKKGKVLGIEHVKLSGKTINLSPGAIETADYRQRRLVLKRNGFSGRSRYDGLEIEKAPGDYALSEVVEGEWYYKHIYFRRMGERIGTYYNISTPVEFYPEKIRYVDLELDVVGWPGGEMGIVDIDELESYTREGYLGQGLKAMAIDVAQTLVEYS